MRTASFIVFIQILCLVGSIDAAAQEWSFGAYTGTAHTVRSDLRLTTIDPATNLTFRAVAYESQSFTWPIYYGYRVARRLPAVAPSLWIEGELIHLKVFARVSSSQGHGLLDGKAAEAVNMADVIQRFSMSHGLNFVFVNVVYRRAMGDVILITRGGAGPTLPHVESVVHQRRREAYELSNIAVQAAGGVEIRLWQRLRGTLEYKLSRVTPEVRVASGEVTLAAVSHHIAFGLAAEF